MKYGIEEITKHYYTGNHLSSTQLVTDGTGVAVQQVEYAPFGEVVNEYNIDWSNGQVPDFKFNAKELDEENGMYYFEARYQSPPVFISRDPLFEKYPMFSPYSYCANNPVKYIDPTGEDLEITGEEQKAAFKELKKGAASHDIKVKMDKNGQISGKYVGKGEISAEGQQIMNVINDKSVKVKINATASNTTEGGHPFFAGTFLGSDVSPIKVGKDDVIGYTATAKQDVNPTDLKAMSDYYGKQGQDMLHEITEAYQGGLLAIANGTSVGNSIKDKKNFSIAHGRAIPQSGSYQIHRLHDCLGCPQIGWKYTVGSYEKDWIQPNR
jgi:RHS repeat-associated protein